MELQFFVILTLVCNYQLTAYKLVDNLCDTGISSRDARDASPPYNNTGYNKKRRKMDEPIIFPEVKIGGRSSYMPRTHGKECVGNLCSEVDDYPYEHVRNLLESIPDIDQLLGTEGGVVDLASKQPFGTDAATNLCPSITHTTYPKKATNTKNQEKFIVNVDGHQQGLIFEVCGYVIRHLPDDSTGENGKCMFSDRFPNDYIAECTQRYAVKRLMALNEEGKPAFDSFEVPSCCVCTFRKNTDRK